MIFEYEELKESVKEIFNTFYNEMNFNISQTISAILNEFENGEGFCKTEECTIFIAIALIFIEEGFPLDEIKDKIILLISSENLIVYKEEIKKEYDLLAKDIEVVDRYL